MKLHPIAIAAASVLAILALGAAAAPWISPYPPNAMDLQAILEPPSLRHWAGTDELGRDIFSRLLHGARPSLLSAAAIVAIGGLIGMVAGCFSGLIGGAVDTVIMRLVDMMLALPGLVIAMALTAALGPSLINAVIALGILSIPGYVRLARGQALALREREFVQTARAMGAGSAFIALRHIAPNVAPAMMVYASFHFGGALLASSALSFIGLGMQPPHPEWGAMVGNGREYVLAAWWYVTFPGLVVALGALSANILGDALRDLTD